MSWETSIPAFMAATSMAPSVGSPKQTQAPSFCCTWASLLRAPIRSSSSRLSSDVGSMVESSSVNSPSGAYPAPLMFTWRVLVLTCVTVISFLVRVPVLSLQITVVLPSVSTLASFLTMAFCLAILAVPSASVMVSTAGRPSGIAETARLMLVMNTCSRVLSWTNQSTKNTKTVSMTLMVASCLPIFSIFWRRGGGSTSMAWTMPAILPNWLFIPVSVITATALPLVTTVPMKTMHFWSPTPASAATESSLFETGLDSPVSAASSTSRLAASMSLPSAGTLLPASSSTMSPGTRFMESMDSSLPSLRTKT